MDSLETIPTVTDLVLIERSHAERLLQMELSAINLLNTLDDLCGTKERKPLYVIQCGSTEVLGLIMGAIKMLRASLT